MFLESLGADPAVHDLFQSYAARGLFLARVAISQRDRYQLFTAGGELPAEAAGALWHRTPDRFGMPVTGDWVAARIVDPSFRNCEGRDAPQDGFLAQGRWPAPRPAGGGRHHRARCNQSHRNERPPRIGP